MGGRNLLLSLVTVLTVGGGTAWAQCGCSGHGQTTQRQGAAGPSCPVTGEPIDFMISVKTVEGPVFFCRPGCIDTYGNAPAKYSRMVATQRESLAHRPKVQVLCPNSGDPVDQNVFAEYDGQRVYFCSKGCIDMFAQNPERFAAPLANSYTYQATCPVMGGAIDPQYFASVANGQKVYFCCGGCEKKLFDDPAKYVPNLAAQGFKLPTAEKRDSNDTARVQRGQLQGRNRHSGHDH